MLLTKEEWQFCLYNGKTFSQIPNLITILLVKFRNKIGRNSCLVYPGNNYCIPTMVILMLYKAKPSMILLSLMDCQMNYFYKHPHWFSRDHSSNSAGLYLALLIFEWNLQILKGKDNNDVYPLTFHSDHSSSLLDFICVLKSKTNLFS